MANPWKCMSIRPACSCCVPPSFATTHCWKVAVNRVNGLLTVWCGGRSYRGRTVVVAAKARIWKTDAEAQAPCVVEIPFDSKWKRMSTTHQMTTGYFAQPLSLDPPDIPAAPYVIYAKGAPEVNVKPLQHDLQGDHIQPLTEADRKMVVQANQQMVSQALRVLGVAFRPLAALPVEVTPESIEKELTFIGLISLLDPLRSGVKPTIAQARQAGIKTVIITGDYLGTAVAIAQRIDLLRPQGKALTGSDLDRLDGEKMAAIVNEVDLYARVSPQHKVKIVETLKARGHVVAMTGDGINDAPALKRADIGVAMGITGTDVSKETADMVLTDDNYASIVSAVEEGHIIYSNIRKFASYLLSANVAEILIIFVSVAARLPLPLTVLELLVLNLITDGAPALALGLEKGDPDIMHQPLRPITDEGASIGKAPSLQLGCCGVVSCHLHGAGQPQGV
jgi:Ca2+-transporting ATPase